MPKVAWGVSFPPAKVAKYEVARRLMLKHVERVVAARVALRQSGAAVPAPDGVLDAVDLLLNASDETRKVVAPPDDPSWSETTSNKVRERTACTVRMRCAEVCT